MVTSASGRRFGRDATDWKWWHNSVPTTLKGLHEKGYARPLQLLALPQRLCTRTNPKTNRYLVTILSNQGGISLKPDPKSVKSDQKRLADFKGKVSAVLTQLDFPISVYAATARDNYRKPRIGMWQELLEDHDLESAESIDLENSFFVGDAGGRDAAGKTPKDHSCVDRCGVSHDFSLGQTYMLNKAETLQQMSE